MAEYVNELPELRADLLCAVARYIEETYIDAAVIAGSWGRNGSLSAGAMLDVLAQQKQMKVPMECTAAPCRGDLLRLLEETDAGFSETLLKLIDRTGKKDPEIYRKAGIDRKLFSKIRKNRDYRPSKATALALAFALELDLEETEDLIGRAGYTLSHSSKFDIIVEYFIQTGNYDVSELNEVLFHFDQPLLGV
ncbi:MAG: hypothetical protein E7443_06825 [Ruminococcaceae bacterium]|nr:hypothetical protein [Oscillospiraceae bacterium]